MNAHDRLRLYLEQRRELGESELVLDSLSVDSVLKMIGAPPGKGATARSPSGAPSSAIPNIQRARAEADAAAPAASVPPIVANTVAPSDPPPRFDNTVSTDWRAALSNLKPGATQKPAETSPGEAVASGASTADSSATAPTSDNATSAASAASAASGNDGTTNPKHAVSFSDDAVAATRAAAAAFPAWLTHLGLPVGLTANPAPGLAATAAAANTVGSINELATVIASCRACSLGALATNSVPGEGNINAEFVCVGEAPGQTEDETGRPFVGAAGQLLTKILAAIQLQREDVFICNVLKHRPPGNRNPSLDEIHACTPYLTRQLALTKPKVILALGTFAAQTLLNTTTALGKLRGQVHQYQGVPLIVTYHPAALLRNEAWKRPAWDDVKLARRILDASRLNDSVSPAT